MNTSDFTTTMLVDQTPEEAYNAINNVMGWWSEEVEGGTTSLNDEFIYRHNDFHYSKHKLIELVPGKKVVWLITDSSLTFIKDKKEWNGTKVVFDISRRGDKTEVRFTHVGLKSPLECFGACTKAWTFYINKSLYNLITTGKGLPNKKENKKMSEAKS